jgi:hypothetical protein
MCLFECSKGQGDVIKVGNIKFKTFSFSNHFSIYHVLCENRDDYLFASRLTIKYDSMMHIGYLKSYNYLDSFYCRESIDNLIISEIKTSISEKTNFRNRIAILFSMEDKGKEFIALLFLFKNKKFKKFIRKASRLTKRTFSGEVMTVKEYQYSKYAKGFIIAKMGSKLSLISIHKF